MAAWSSYRARRFKLLDLYGHFYVRKSVRSHLYQRLWVRPLCSVLALL